MGISQSGKIEWTVGLGKKLSLLLFQEASKGEVQTSFIFKMFTYVYSKNWSNHQKDNTKLSWILEKPMLKEIMEKYKEHNKIKVNIIVLKFNTKT